MPGPLCTLRYYCENRFQLCIKFDIAHKMEKELTPTFVIFFVFISVPRPIFIVEDMCMFVFSISVFTGVN